MTEVPPELNPMLVRDLDAMVKGGLCGECGACPHCATTRREKPLGWCDGCLNCGCWQSGRFGRGIFGQALLFPHVLRDVTQTTTSTVMRLDGLRFECHGRSVDARALADLVGQHICSWVEYDGVTRVAPVPSTVTREIARMTGWRFADA